MALLEVRELTRSFYGIHALGGVDLRVEAHRITGLIGPNGAGKTTILRAIARLVPFQGDIVIGGHPVTGLSSRNLARV